mmetsp:Transcript_37688/g.63426  ORF Transcript_37688/g.63426 Transcript_37688/m.63426 type:complete len:286 (+) Transcript_37688:679-1536(+)
MRSSAPSADWLSFFFSIVSRYPSPKRLLRNVLDPMAARWPADMMATRSERISASSMKWVVRMMARPALILRMTSQLMRRLYGSIPLVGSSRNTTLGLPRKAMERDSLRFCPPDSDDTNESVFSSRPTSCSSSVISWSTYCGGMPVKVAYNRMCSFTVSSGHRMSNCGHTPRLLRMASISVRMSIPSISARPSSGASPPVSMEMVVVLPAPLCPKRHEISFLANVNESLFTARTSPKVLPSPMTFTAAFASMAGSICWMFRFFISEPSSGSSAPTGVMGSVESAFQ